MEDLSGRMDVCVGRPASAPTMNTLLRRTLTASPRPTSVLTLFRSQRLHTSSAARMTAAQHVEGAPPTAVAADKYRPFLDASFYTPGDVKSDWTYQIASADGLDQLSEARQMHAALPRPLRVLVLYGSNRPRSFSKLMAFEAARMLHHLGCDLRIYDPHGLPLKDDYDHPDVDATGGTEAHPKVVELRQLVTWSEAQFWCSPEQHGNITGIMKTMIDHIPLSLGSVRPTQGKVLAVSQVNGGSQSFNAVNSLRILGRWMRMFTIPNQASLPKAWTQFTAEGRMMDSSNRDRLVDVVEELVKVSCLFYGRDETFASRWSERKERAEKGRLLSQAEKEKQKKQEKAAAAVAAKDEKITPDVL